jgi:hypothetical protein
VRASSGAPKCVRTGVLQRLELYEDWRCAKTEVVRKLALCEDWGCAKTCAKTGVV